MSKYEWNLLFDICDQRQELARAFYQVANKDKKALAYMDSVFDAYYSGLINRYQVFKYLFENLLRDTEYHKDLNSKGIIVV